MRGRRRGRGGAAGLAACEIPPAADETCFLTSQQWRPSPGAAQLHSQSVSSYSDSGVPGAAAVADGADRVLGAQSPVEEKAWATAALVVAASPTTSTTAPAARAWRANRSGHRRRLIEKVSAADAPTRMASSTRRTVSGSSRLPTSSTSPGATATSPTLHSPRARTTSTTALHHTAIASMRARKEPRMNHPGYPGEHHPEPDRPAE